MLQQQFNPSAELRASASSVESSKPVQTVTIFTDGACSFNPGGPGGWAARLLYGDGRVVELGGFVPETTNNRMELQAAIEGLRAVFRLSSGVRRAQPSRRSPSDIAITLVTDSEYLRKGITEWIHGWKRRSWLTAAKKPVLNQDLWRTLDQLNTPAVQWQYTPGHAGDPDNERCDQIAQAFARGETPSLHHDRKD